MAHGRRKSTHPISAAATTTTREGQKGANGSTSTPAAEAPTQGLEMKIPPESREFIPDRVGINITCGLQGDTRRNSSLSSSSSYRQSRPPNHHLHPTPRNATIAPDGGGAGSSKAGGSVELVVPWWVGEGLRGEGVETRREGEEQGKASAKADAPRPRPQKEVVGSSQQGLRRCGGDWQRRRGVGWVAYRQAQNISGRVMPRPPGPGRPRTRGSRWTALMARENARRIVDEASGRGVVCLCHDRMSIRCSAFRLTNARLD